MGRKGSGDQTVTYLASLNKQDLEAETSLK